jgi:tetratricopeptide (TPR) repeat protein
MNQCTYPPMINAELSTAESQFRNGNFETAVTLYSRILSEIEKLDNSSEACLAPLVLKLGECHYGAGNFEPARQAYEKLLSIQERNENITSKERVFTLVKAAKNYEKCADKASAQARYEEAYAIAKLALPVKHFLRQTVVEAYAQWLRMQKSNPLVLSILESELQDLQPLWVKEEAAAATAAPVETKQVREKREPKKSSQDFSDLKFKLGSKRQSEKVIDSKGVSESKGSRLPHSDLDKSISRQVAARKFLRMSTAPNEAKVDRLRLKNSLDKNTPHNRNLRQVDQSENAVAQPVHEIVRTLNSEQLYDHARDNDEFILDQLRVPDVESIPDDQYILDDQHISADIRGDQHISGDQYNQYNPDNRDNEYIPEHKHFPCVIHFDNEQLLAESAALMARLGINNSAFENFTVEEVVVLDETNAVGAQPSGLTLKSTHDVAMRGSDRSYFGREEEKIKGPKSESPVDLLDRVLSNFINLQQVLKFGVPTAVLLGCVCFVVHTILNSKPEYFVDAPKFVRPLINQVFATADGALSIAVKPASLEITGKKLRRKPNVYFWRGTTNDEFRLMQGTFKNSIWLSPSPDGLVSDKGQVFYSPNAPEKKVLEIMASIKNYALNYCAAAGHYPNPEGVQPKTYINPVSQKYQDLNVYSMIVGKQRPADADKRLSLDLERGQLFNNETSGKPGTVSVFCVRVGDTTTQSIIPDLTQSGMPDQTYTESLYIHGFDRNGALIKVGVKQKPVLIELSPTGAKTSETGLEELPYQNCDICLSQTGVPNAAEIWLKYFAFALAVMGVIGFLIWTRQAGPTDETAL